MKPVVPESHPLAKEPGFLVHKRCPKCNGSGAICTECLGTGYVTRPSTCGPMHHFRAGGHCPLCESKS